MTSDQIGEMAYLAILGGAVLVWYISRHKLSLGKVAQQALAWVLIFVAVIAAVGVWDDIRATITPQQSVHSDSNQIIVPRARDGHYYLTLMINDQPVQFLVDTGASQMVLNKADADKIGLNPDDMIYSSVAYTANGTVATAPVRLSRVELGPYSDDRVSAWVNGGELDQSLLGMSYLQRWSSIEIRDGSLVLTR